MFDENATDRATRQLFNVFFSIEPTHLDVALQVPFGCLYRLKRIQKKSGGVRIIYPPCDPLKTVQALMLRGLYFWPVHPRLQAYRPGSSIITNARLHLSLDGDTVKEWILHLDLKDAFPSVKEYILRPIYEGIFGSKPLPKKLSPMSTTGYYYRRYRRGRRNAMDQPDVFAAAREQSSFRKRFMTSLRDLSKGLDQEVVRTRFIDLLVYLTFWKGELPQGAPTSPYLLNIALTETGIVDAVFALCQERDCRFSIYCDDFVITSPFKPSRRFCRLLQQSLQRLFRFNHEKTHWSCLDGGAHLVTGIKIASNPRESSWQRQTARLTLSQVKIKSWRGKIKRATAILQSGRHPNQEEDGVSIMAVLGYIAHLKQVFEDEEKFPSAIKKPTQEFLALWQTIRPKRKEKSN